MKWLTLAICLLLAACGGGGGSSPAPASDPAPPGPLQGAAPTLDRYQPYYMNGQRLRGIIQRLDTGDQYTEWRAEPNKIWWSATYADLFDVRVCEGKRWSFLLGFEDAAIGQVYSLQNVRTTLDGHELNCPQDGAPYEPFDIPLDFQQTVEQWGYIINPGMPIPYYWKSTFVYGTVAENPCWIGDGPRIRSVIVQSEVWWDRNGGWSRGHPNVSGELPWVNGQPVKIDVTMGFEAKNAIDAGVLWRGGDETVQLCLRDVGAW